MGFLSEKCTFTTFSQDVIESSDDFDCGHDDLDMDFIKSWFIDPYNKTGCRFIVVDSFNEKEPINYYLKNDFDFLFSSEEQEIEYLTPPNDELKTRLMIFDLIVLSPGSVE